MRKPILGLATTLIVLFSGLHSALAFNVIEGSAFEVTGPDDLLFDPATSVIAVDIFGNQDRVVNGVQFYTDRVGLGSAVTAEGVVSSGGVTLTTGLVNQIDNWSTAAVGPAFTGGTPDSAANLSEIMRDIRWANAGAGQTVNVAITGLEPGVLYTLQMLFNEGAGNRNRRFDIAVNGLLAVDDYSSQGGDGVWSPANSFAYSGDFNADGGGTISIVLGREPLPLDPNNTPFTGADNNAILQALIVHVNAPPTPPSDIVLTPDVVNATASVGAVVGNLTSVDPNGGTHTYALVAGDGDSDNGKFQIVGDELQVNADISGDVGNALTIRVESTDGTAMAFAEAVTVNVAADFDNDNLLDTWELNPNWANPVAGLNDLTGLKTGPGPGTDTGDFDGDGSPDGDEFTNGTDPTNDDSDNDGLLDGVETNTGTFNDANDTGTDPNDDDSDDDGLNDGDELTAGADPNNADSDGDTISDGDEVNRMVGGLPAPTDPTEADTDGDGVPDNTDPDPLDPNINSLTFVRHGEVIEFGGPDDLRLDPATAVIAVAVNGDVDRVVNGVTFLTDGQGGVTGTATEGPVSVTTSAANQINNWAALQTYTGADQVSADNLALIMQDIRWAPAPTPLTVDIDGLTTGALYEVQLLFNEGGTRDRFWDIELEGTFVVDNFSSKGKEGVGVWSPTNGFAYVCEFEGPADGILNIVLQQNIAGLDRTAAPGTDGNPILQGIIVHLLEPIDLGFDVEQDPGGDLVLSWNSKAGKVYDILSSTDPEGDGEKATWAVFDPGTGPLTDLEADPPRNSVTFAKPAEGERYFVVVQKPAPPAFSDDFELDNDGWTTGQNNGNPGTDWEWGAPAFPGPFEGADFSLNCSGTNISGNYGFNTDSWLRSPSIDLTGAGITGARLQLQQWLDIEDLVGADAFGFIRVLRASDGAQLGADIAAGITGSTFQWNRFSASLPPEAIGEVIQIEFQFMTGDPGGTDYAGWYIDDVEVSLE